MSEEKKNKLYLKWWFWLIVLTIVIAICVTLIIFVGYDMINPDKNLSKLSQDLQSFHNNTFVYQSANKENIIIDCNFSDLETELEKEEEIGKIIGKNLETLSLYKNIQLNLNIDDGQKCILNINPQTQEVDKTTQKWILEDSEAQKEKEEILAKLEAEENKLNLNISGLQEKEKSLNEQIEKLNGEVAKAKGQPKTYPAGHLTAGTDIPVGKYKIYGGNSNFVVYSSTGSLEVNIILGTRFGVEEYIYTFKTGDKIEANSSFKLVEVE